MATCDIITDVVLIVFPIPLVIMSRMPMTKKVSMVFLFLLSLFLIGITAYRIPSTASRDYSQQFRSLLASIEILAATCVANVIVIGSFLRDKGVRKVKYRGGSIGESDGDGTEDNMLTRPATRQIKPSIAQRHWGSDEDLVRDFGVGLSADLRHELVMNGTARLAPMAEPANTPHHEISTPEPTINPHGRGLLDPAWTFRKASTPHRHQRRDSDASSDSDMSTDFKMRKLEPYKDEPSSPAEVPETPYRKMSFFDVGGLVNVTSSEQASAGQHTRRLSRSGQNFIADIGGLLGSPTTAQRPDDSSTSSGYRSSNLLLPEHAIRERPRSPGHGVSLVQALQDTRIDNSSHLVLHEVGDPNSLTFSDAGRLLR
ncbi:hypothetical protein LTR64_008117 [Lithohypha guttulata]|uniref:uncharacterized protein n=1 Tax=Lithohypha guttulata TaxID=1690604 RepID=UPI002DE10C08|nr:hypothetical protein LTR51_008013 [Lithohypha guttulata]